MSQLFVEQGDLSEKECRMNTIFTTLMYFHSLVVGIKRILISESLASRTAKFRVGGGKQKVPEMTHKLREDDTI